MSSYAFDIRSFLDENGVPYVAEGHKHCRPGWVQVQCPFCIGNPGWHLGYNEDQGGFVCWRCGGKKTGDVLKALTGRYHSIGKLTKQYRSKTVRKARRRLTRAADCKWPSGTASMAKAHKRYLERRGFDPDYLEHQYRLKGTGPVGSYSRRIILPIFHKGVMVSYQGRSILKNPGLKYKACPQDLEVMDHKHTLYGLEHAVGDSCALVEGAPDVWRLGPGACGCYGIKYRPEQVRLLKRFSRVFMIFDPEEQAQMQAERIAAGLALTGTVVEMIELDGDDDPGDLSQDDADHMMRDLGIRK